MMSSAKKITCILLIVICSISEHTLAQTNAFGKHKTSDPKPFRVFYFGYDLVHPGINLGPEYDFLWSKHEKISCEKGYKLVDKQLLFIPQFGFFTEPASSFDLFINIEVDFRTTYHKGMFFELFTSAGYAHGFGDGVENINDMDLDEVIKESHGSFMPQIGLGTGYNFDKNGEIPLIINFRVLSASIKSSKSFFLPAFQLGITYDL